MKSEGRNKLSSNLQTSQGRIPSTFSRSPENLLTILPVGLVSKKAMGAREMPDKRSRWIASEAAAAHRKSARSLAISTRMKKPHIPPYTPRYSESSVVELGASCESAHLAIHKLEPKE